MKNNRDTTLVIYHGGCSDGFGGAWSAWKKLGSSADYYGAIHGTPPPDVKGREVYMIDFSYPETDMRSVVSLARHVTVIDHHVTARLVIQLAQNHVYSVRHSGAVLAWQYFHPGKPIPRLLRHIEDIDIWKFAMPKTKEVIAFLENNDFSFPAWSRIARDLETPIQRKRIVGVGSALLAYQERVVEELVRESAQRVVFEGYETLAINTPKFTSYVGARGVKLVPPIAVVWSVRGSAVSVSLRSNGRVDVGVLAKKHGGGGHKSAAGFRLRFGEPFPWRVLPEQKTR